MAQTIIGTFDDATAAQRALDELKRSGVPEQDIHVSRNVGRGSSLSITTEVILGSAVYDILHNNGARTEVRQDAGSMEGWERLDANNPALSSGLPSAAGADAATTGHSWQDSSKVGTAAGAASGAATGAALGSAGGPIGAVVGGIVGAAVGAATGAAGDVAGEIAEDAANNDGDRRNTNKE
jgi:hypothetical protein